MSIPLISACARNMPVVTVLDHSNQGIWSSGSPYRKTPSIATHFMKSQNESASSWTRFDQSYSLYARRAM